jgi:hypothetical protein
VVDEFGRGDYGGTPGPGVLTGENKISHGRSRWQTRRSCLAMGPLASSIR